MPTFNQLVRKGREAADHLGALLEFRQHAVCLPSLDLQGRLAFLPRIPFWQAYLRDLEFYHMRILKSIRKSLDFAKLSGPFPVRNDGGGAPTMRRPRQAVFRRA